MKINLNISRIKNMKLNAIKNKIHEWDKSTLRLYRENKNIINQARWMRNGNKYSTMMIAHWVS